MTDYTEYSLQFNFMVKDDEGPVQLAQSILDSATKNGYAGWKIVPLTPRRNIYLQNEVPKGLDNPAPDVLR